MSTDSEDAFIITRITALAVLYDAFAHAIDPYSNNRDEAERVFNREIAEWHDSLPDPKPTLHEFRKGIIIRCRAHLKSTRSKADISNVFKGGDNKNPK